jgi:hyaluronan synthase
MSRRHRHPNQVEAGTIGYLALVALFAVSVGVYLAMKLWLLRDGMYSPLLVTYSALLAGYTVSRAIVGHRYRSQAPTLAELPSVAVIVPVKNEGLMIGVTLRHLFATTYPVSLYEVIAIDDGSDDETSAILSLARRQYPRLRVITMEKNVGKRRAMAAGIGASSSEIVVVIDSDTVIEPGGVTKLVANFGDLSVAAVSGNTRIRNETVNLLTQVQALIYEISFRIHKSAESAFRTVTCCPGCFSAYRRSAIEPILEEWTSQRFMGEHTIFGDDRALTMMMLKHRWRVVYEPTAFAHTEVPEEFRGYLRQQLRWKKSWIQQGVRGAAFMWRRHPLSSLWFYTGLLISLIGTHIVISVLIIGTVIDGVFPVRFVVGGAALGLAMVTYLSIQRRDLRRVTAAVCYPFLAIVLALQMPFAIARLADARWGTR